MGVGLLIPRQGLAEAPPRSELPAWGRPSLNLQGNLHLGRGRERTHPVTVKTSSYDGGRVICRGTKLGWGLGKGYLLSGSSRAWNLQGEKEQSFSPRGIWQLPGPAPPHCGQVPPPLSPGWKLILPQTSLWRTVGGFQARGTGPHFPDSQRTGQSSLSQPPAPSPSALWTPSTHSHTRTGVVQDQRAPQLKPKRLWQGQKLVCGCCHQGQKRPEPPRATCETQPTQEDLMVIERGWWVLRILSEPLRQTRLKPDGHRAL